MGVSEGRKVRWRDKPSSIWITSTSSSINLIGYNDPLCQSRFDRFHLHQSNRHRSPPDRRFLDRSFHHCPSSYVDRSHLDRSHLNRIRRKMNGKVNEKANGKANVKVKRFGLGRPAARKPEGLSAEAEEVRNR